LEAVVFCGVVFGCCEFDFYKLKLCRNCTGV